MSYVALPSDNRQSWLEQRKNFITASDVPALLGASRWKDRSAVIAEKLGRGTPFTDRLATYFGRIGEAHVLQALHELTGIDVRPNNQLFVNEGVVGLAATPDAMAALGFTEPKVYLLRAQDIFHSTYNEYAKHCRLGSVAAVDVKVVASKGRSRWKTEKPDEAYYCQVQAQMLVTGAPVGLLVAKVDAHEMYGYCFEADTFLHDLIKCEVAKAMEEIQTLKKLVDNP